LFDGEDVSLITESPDDFDTECCSLVFHNFKLGTKVTVYTDLGNFKRGNCTEHFQDCRIRLHSGTTTPFLNGVWMSTTLFWSKHWLQNYV